MTSGPDAARQLMHGNGLPGRWAGRLHFTVLETAFGLGDNFLATWRAWRQDPARCERLHYVAIVRQPLAAAGLARARAARQANPPPPSHTAQDALAAELLKAWPPLTSNLHALAFERGRVRLLLAPGELARLLPTLRLSADAFFLDGCGAEPRVLKALGRLAAPGATLAALGAAPGVREGLTTAGFTVASPEGAVDSPAVLVARHAPRAPPRVCGAPALAGHTAGRTAAVIGAGIAGAAAARALADAGFNVMVVERNSAPAAATSGNPAGIFHGTVHAGDGPHARLFRTAALTAERTYQQAIASGVPGSVAGLLRVGGALPAMQAVAQQQGLPHDYVQPLDQAAASARAGVALPGAAWWYPGGGWIDPVGLVHHQMRGLSWRGSTQVAALERCDVGWRLLDTSGGTVVEAAVVVLANAADAERLLPSPGPLPWPLSTSRGQLSWFGTPAARALRVPVAGDGYALPLPSGDVLCGATHSTGSDLGVRAADHGHNLERLLRMTGVAAPGGPAACAGRVGLRLLTPDRLPVAGAVPSSRMPPGQRMDQPRLLPREPGLYVLTGLGGRGLTLAPLLAAFIAAQAGGTPWPMEQALADAVDPARWQVRAARRGSAAVRP